MSRAYLGLTISFLCKFDLSKIYEESFDDLISKFTHLKDFQSNNTYNSEINCSVGLIFKFDRWMKKMYLSRKENIDVLKIIASKL